MKKEPKPKPRKPVADTKTDRTAAEDATNGTSAHAQNGVKKKGGKRKKPRIEPPPPDMVLKFPIEVWISSGENFVKPERESRFSLGDAPNASILEVNVLASHWLPLGAVSKCANKEYHQKCFLTKIAQMETSSTFLHATTWPCSIYPCAGNVFSASNSTTWSCSIWHTRALAMFLIHRTQCFTPILRPRVHQT